MLSERQLEALLEVFRERMQGVTDEYLMLLGEHIRQIGSLKPSDVHRLTELARMGANLEQVQRAIAQAAQVSVSDLERVLRAAAESDAEFARQWFASDWEPAVKGAPKLSTALERVLKAQLRVSAQSMQNLSQTTIVSNAYQRAVDLAVQTVQTGITDYRTAIRRAMREAGTEGLKVQYPSGVVRRLDTAMRQNVLDAVREMDNDILRQLGDEYGADGVEISAHALCAEDHLPYQGLQFSEKEFERIQNTLRRPFGKWNCKHTIFPIILGISEPAHDRAELESYRQSSMQEIEIDGVKKTRYGWTQEQRHVESAIRERKDVANLAKASGDDALRREAQAQINALQKRYTKISAAAGLDERPERMTVAGFRRVKTTGELAISKFSRTITSDGIHVHTTVHVIDRIRERGVAAEDVIDGLTNPLDISKIKYDELGRPSKQYIGEKATVAVNPENNNIVTAWPTSIKRAQKLKERKNSQ